MISHEIKLINLHTSHNHNATITHDFLFSKMFFRLTSIGRKITDAAKEVEGGMWVLVQTNSTLTPAKVILLPGEQTDPVAKGLLCKMTLLRKAPSGRSFVALPRAAQLPITSLRVILQPPTVTSQKGKEHYFFEELEAVMGGLG